MPLWELNVILFAKIALAFILGFTIGIEREYHHSAAGVRTYAAVCLGSCVFGLISIHAEGMASYQGLIDPTRIAAQIVSGIGFIGAGVIFRDGSRTNGLTTAATIWAVSAVGLAVAFDMYVVAISSTLLIIVLLLLNYFPPWARFKLKNQLRFERLQNEKKEI